MSDCENVWKGRLNDMNLAPFSYWASSVERIYSHGAFPSQAITVTKYCTVLFASEEYSLCQGIRPVDRYALERMVTLT